MSVVYGNTAVSKPGTVVRRTGGTSRTCSIATRRSSGAIARRTCAGVADRAEHHFGLGRRRHDVGRDAAGDQADGVVRPAEHGIATAARSTAARRARRSACRSPTRRARETTSARRVRVARSLRRRTPRVASAEPVVGRLAVDEEPAAAGAARFAARAPSLPRSSPTTNSRPTRVLAGPPQPIGGRDLRGQNAFRVARRRGR